MTCPICGAETEVLSKRRAFRDRKCSNWACGFRFTTREDLFVFSASRTGPRQDRHLTAKCLARRMAPPLPQTGAAAIEA